MARQPVEREVEDRQASSKHSFPKVELGLGLIAPDPIVLPGREVAVLQAKLWQVGLSPLRKRLVGSPKLTLQQGQGLCIRNNVVQRQHQEMVGGREPEQMSAH